MSAVYLVTDPAELYDATGHDLALFRSLSQIFLDTAPAMLTRMQDAPERLPGQPATAFIVASHTLRGITALVGARVLTGMLADLEAQAKGGACPTGAALEPVALQLALVCAEVRTSMAVYQGIAP